MSLGRRHDIKQFFRNETAPTSELIKRIARFNLDYWLTRKFAIR